MRQEARSKSGYTLVLDLMVNEQGQVQILELQDGAGSAYTGYGRAYRRFLYKPSLQNKIYRDLSENNIAPQNPYISLFGPIRWGSPAPALFQRICDNKAAQAAFAYPACPSIFPWQQVYAYTPNETPYAAIQANCPTEKVVIKVPEAVRGEGVFYARRDASGFYGIAAAEAAQKFGSFLVPGTAEPQQGLVVAQACVDPRLITVGNYSYRPTIRSVLTISWPDDAPFEKIDMQIHGSYYKLPALPFNGSGPFDPRRLKSSVHEGLGAAKIEGRDAAAIQAQALPAVEAIFNFCRDHTPEDVALKKLGSNNVGDVLTALDFLRHLDDSDFKFSDSFALSCRDALLAQQQNHPHIGVTLLQPWKSENMQQAVDASVQPYAAPLVTPTEVEAQRNKMESEIRRSSEEVTKIGIIVTAAEETEREVAARRSNTRPLHRLGFAPSQKEIMMKKVGGQVPPELVALCVGLPPNALREIAEKTSKDYAKAQRESHPEAIRRSLAFKKMKYKNPYRQSLPA